MTSKPRHVTAIMRCDKVSHLPLLRARRDYPSLLTVGQCISHRGEIAKLYYRVLPCLQCRGERLGKDFNGLLVASRMLWPGALNLLTR